MLAHTCDTVRCLQVLTSHTAQAGLVEIQPWTATWFQQQMPQSKLLLHALEHINGERMLLFQSVRIGCKPAEVSQMPASAC